MMGWTLEKPRGPHPKSTEGMPALWEPPVTVPSPHAAPAALQDLLQRRVTGWVWV